jgi:hypothetical protein
MRHRREDRSHTTVLPVSFANSSRTSLEIAQFVFAFFWVNRSSNATLMLRAHYLDKAALP